MSDERETIDLEYLIRNLEGCVGKLEEARTGELGMTWERAGRDSLDPLKHYTAQLRGLFDGKTTLEDFVLEAIDAGMPVGPENRYR